MTLPRYAVWLFILIWAVGRVALTAAWYSTYWNKRWKPDRLTLPMLQLAGAAWWLAATAYPAVLIHNRTFGFGDFVRWVVFLAVAVYLNSVLRRKLEQRITGCYERPFPWNYAPRPRWLVSAFWVVASLLLLVTFPLGFLLLALFYLVLWIAHRSRRLSRTFRRSAFELDTSTPLFSDIAAVMLPFGRNVYRVYCRRRPAKSGILRIPPVAVGGYTDDRETIPIIPYENLTLLNAHTFLTALAVFWSGRVRPNSFSAQQPGCFWGCSVTLILGTVAFVTALVVGWIYTVALDGGSAIALPVIVFAVVFIAWPALRQLGLFRTRLDTYQGAFEVLRTIAGEWPSSQAFVNALAEHHAFYHGIHDADLVIHQISLDRALSRFCLNRCNENLNDLLAGARAHVSDMIRCWAEETRNAMGAKPV